MFMSEEGEERTDAGTKIASEISPAISPLIVTSNYFRTRNTNDQMTIYSTFSIFNVLNVHLEV